MHPNAGSQLRVELSVLPNILLNPSANFGEVNVHDQSLSSPVTTNATQSSGGSSVLVEKKFGGNSYKIWWKSRLQRTIFHVRPHQEQRWIRG